jgi:hypothetical protein
MVGGEKDRFNYLMCKLMSNSVVRSECMENNYTMLHVNCTYIKGGVLNREKSGLERNNNESHFLAFEVVDQGPKMSKRLENLTLKPLTEKS